MKNRILFVDDDRDGLRRPSPKEPYNPAIAGSAEGAEPNQATTKTLGESERELRIQNRITQSFMVASNEEAYERALQAILDATESRHGVFGYIDEHGALVCPSMTRDVLDQCRMREKRIVFPRHQWGGIWGRALLEKRLLCSNQRSQVPPGHLPMLRSMAAPIIFQGESIGLIHIANKGSDYDERDQRLLDTIAMNVAPILHARVQRDRQEEARRQAEEELREYRGHLEELVAARTDQLRAVNEELRREIADRKQALEKLRKLSRALDQSPVSIIISDILGNIEYVNPKFTETTGFAIEEVLGKSLAMLGSCDMPEHAFQDLLKMIRSGGEWRGELQCRTKSGQQRWVRALFSPITGADETITHFLVIKEDITDRKKADERLRMLAHAIECANECICISDTENRLLFVNDAFLRTYGYREDELIGKQISIVQSKRHPPPLTQTILPSTLQGCWRGAAINRRKDGSEFPIALSTSPVRDEYGHAFALVGVAQDVTEREKSEETLRQTEAQLRQAQKMEAIGRLAGGVAHDFNNLLTVIIGVTEMTLASLDRDDPLRGDLEQVRDAGDRAAALTRQLLAFSRRQVLQPKVLDINAVIADLNKMLPRLIGEDIELVIDLEPELGRVMADPGQIEQVIMNLVVNARDAMPQGGELTLTSKNVNVDEDYAAAHPGMVAGNYVLLTISDNGCGMDDQILVQIFEPFFTTKERGKGTGLGLSTVYGIVKQSHGYVEADSKPGHGSTFKIYLPRISQVEEAAAIPSWKGAKASAGSETVLLVEDEESVRKLALKALEKQGYRVIESSGGAEALQTSRRHEGPIHLLVTDLVMPGMSGRDLADRIVAKHPGTKVLYMSGYTDNIKMPSDLLDSGRAFLQKPFTPRELARKVREVLDTWI